MFEGEYGPGKMDISLCMISFLDSFSFLLLDQRVMPQELVISVEIYLTQL